MTTAMNVIEKIKEFDTSVCIIGESGTGKSMFARLIIKSSPRVKKKFMEVNCGSLSPTLLESELFGHVRGAFTGALRDRIGKLQEVDGGTIFLDDVTSASLEMQTKLLHVLDSGRIQRVGDNKPIDLNVRFICASNKDIYSEVKSGRFREDFYYRIAVVLISLPPLRERPEEIIPLINHFISQLNNKFGQSFKGIRKQDEWKALSYTWPGNVRELRNTVERSFVLSKGDQVCLDIRELCYGLSRRDLNTVDLSLNAEMREYERKILCETLNVCAWDISRASKKLSISRSTLFNKIKRHKISRNLKSG
jgi:DNA-binding NtrC family response regulator